MKPLILTILFCALYLFNATAQTEATTKEGKVVILNDDGTWKAKPDQTEAVVAKKAGPKSYECNDLIKTSKDKVTGSITIGSTETLILSDDGKKGIGINIYKFGENISISMTVVGASSCIDDTDKINILFRDGSKLEMNHSSKYNCDSSFTLYFGGSFGRKKQLEQLISKEIETMRVWTTNGFVERDLSPEDSQQLMKTLACITSM